MSIKLKTKNGLKHLDLSHKTKISKWRMD